MTFSKYLPSWFVEALQIVAKNNDYNQNDYTVEKCEKKGCWTPCDLILREFLEDYGKNAEEFLGITKTQTMKCAYYIKQNQLFLKHIDFYSKKAYSKKGLLLWDNWKL